MAPFRRHVGGGLAAVDRKSTRLNSSHLVISYAVFCLKKKKKLINRRLLDILLLMPRFRYQSRQQRELLNVIKASFDGTLILLGGSGGERSIPSGRLE